MQPLVTTKLSSKGQLVIPEAIRAALHLKRGDQFVALAQDDVIILKRIAPPTLQAFDQLIEQARKHAHLAGLKPSDLPAILEQARKKHARHT